MEWSREARRLIGEVHATLPADATLAQRKRAIRDAFPDSWRGASWPYKAWLNARKAYLKKFDDSAPAPLFDGWERDPVSGRPIIPADPPRRCRTNIVTVDGDCPACLAINGELCKRPIP